MSVLSKLAGTFQSTFQIAKGGAKLKNNSGVIEIRNAGDSAYANVKADQSQFATALINSNAQVKATSGGQVTFRDAADSANAKVFAADPLTTDLQGLATVNYINSNPPTTAASIKSARIQSGSYATTYTTSATLPNTAVVTRCIVDVVVALDVGITIEIGTDEAGQAARFQATTDNDTQTVGSYETTPFNIVKSTGGAGSDQKFLITLSSLPTVGTVNIFVEYVVPQSW
ncbi:MAG: hypothetical protein EBT79_13365 [Actinobacteria bacterium]|nr:hypothetical protein [Actinomycetota bacterium]NBR68236.1 hypothetical protein [Actinomycetota bacterium]